MRLAARNCLSDEQTNSILEYAASCRNTAEQILMHDSITAEMHILTHEEFLEHPLSLDLSGFFSEQSILYTWSEYLEHITLTQNYQKDHPGHMFVASSKAIFQNIQIFICKSAAVIVSKTNTPAVHFVIHHPKMLHAFENMTIPIIDEC